MKLIEKEDYLKAKKIVEEYEQQMKIDNELPRYFVDIRCGCGAVRDKWHKTYNKEYSGLHNDTADIVEYKAGYLLNNQWAMKQEDIDYLNQLSERLNNEV